MANLEEIKEWRENIKKEHSEFIKSYMDLYRFENFDAIDIFFMKRNGDNILMKLGSNCIRDESNPLDDIISEMSLVFNDIFPTLDRPYVVQVFNLVNKLEKTLLFEYYEDIYKIKKRTYELNIDMKLNEAGEFEYDIFKKQILSYEEQKDGQFNEKYLVLDL